MFTIEFDHFYWPSQFYREWKKPQNYSAFKISAKVRVCDLGENLKMIKTYLFCSIHQENRRKSCLQLNFIILTDFHSFTMNEDKLQN